MHYYEDYIARRDLNGDQLLAIDLIDSAISKDWEQVEKLLAEGADPRMCRSTDNNCVESALIMALAARRYDIARKLYDAGDRLGDR